MRSPFLSAIVAGSLLISATAASARQPGPVPARSSAEVENSEELGGLLMIVGLVVVLLVIGVFVIFDDDEEDIPHSP